MITEIYNFKQQRSGDTFNGIRLTCTRISNEIESPIDLTNVEIKMQIKKDACFAPIIDISTTEGIELEDASNGIFRISSFLVPEVETFNYIYDMQFTFPNGVVQTYLKGNFPIISDITR